MASDSHNGNVTGNGARAEQALRASELSYRRLFESAKDGILILDFATGCITDANPFLCKLLGFSLPEMVGQTVGDLSPFKDIVTNQAMFKLLQEHGYVRYEDLPLETKNGRKIAVEFVSNVYQAGDKQVIQCNVRDITERKKSEQWLKQLNTELTTRNEELVFSQQIGLLQSTALKSIANAVVITNIKGTILWVNPAFTDLTGYSYEEVIGKNPRLLKSGQHDREFYKNLWETILAGKTWRGDFINRRKDGTLYHDEHTITPVRSKEGVITHFVAIMNDMTERLQAEEALREREAKFRAIFDAANDSIFLVHDGLFVDCNAKGLELFGVMRDQIIGQPPARFSPSTQPDGRDSQEKASELFQRVLAGQPQFFEWVHHRPDGTLVYSDVSLSRFELHGDLYVQAIARDITERKEAEKQLRWRTAFFEAQVHSALDGILVVNSEGNKVLQNQRMVDLWGIPKEFADAVDDQWQLAWITKQNKNPRQFAEKVAYLTAHPDEVSRDEIELFDGRLFDRYSAPVRGQDGKYYGRIWSFRDITERKRNEEQIAEQATFLDKARDAIFVRDLEGKILFWNMGAEHLYGWTRQEVVGRKMDELLYTHPKKLEEAYSLTINQGEWNGEFQHFTKDKRELTIESRWTLIRDDKGHPKSILAINTDITERKKLEAQFMRARRMESIGTLAGGIAHDLNNILAPILMSIELLKETSSDPQSKKILETIEVSAKRGADIVRQVLSFVRGMEGEKIEVQPKHLLKDLESIIKNTFPKDIRLQFSTPNDTWTILGDPTQVHQVLLNLCVNARDAMPNGGTLTVGLENCVLDEQYAAMNLQAKPGRYVAISVTDSGTGMPRNILDKIFDPFFTTKGLTKGTGLGLSTVMAIVKSHEGIINVYSEPGKGTTFRVYLPAMGLSSEALEKQIEPVGPPRGNGETILVVDDEVSILIITSQTLQAFGYRVLTATNGAQAVAVYAEHKNEIAIVLTDMMMPIMDGTTTIHALRGINPTVRIVAASGLASDVGHVRSSGLSVKHFLMKPYTAATLLNTMRAILDEV